MWGRPLLLSLDEMPGDLFLRLTFPVNQTFAVFIPSPPFYSRNGTRKIKPSRINEGATSNNDEEIAITF